MSISKKIFTVSIIIIFLTVAKTEAQIAVPFSEDSLNTVEILLGEVEVVASKDKLTLNEMPAAVSLIVSQQIENNEINALDEVSGLVPNFFMPDYGSKLTSPVYIRGIGSRINSPSVGLYVDNVPYFEKAAFDFDFYDIANIEVLKGPQGTLYGRNTMGGIISISTRSPFDYQGTRLKLTAGNYGYYNLNAGHYGKINNSFGYALSANYLQQDGFFTNRYSEKKIDHMDSYSFRLKLNWKINDKLSVKNIISFENSKQGGYPYAIYNDSLGQPEDINYNQESSYNRNLLSDALVINYNHEKFDFISTTSFQHLDDDQKIDQDFTRDSLYFVEQRQKQKLVSQEMIIRSKKEKKYNWLFGVYGFIQHFDKQVDVDIYGPGMKLFKDYDHTISGYAAFHQSTIKDLLTEGLNLTAGFRIDFENDQLHYIYDREIKNTLNNVADTSYPALEYFEVSPKVALNYYRQGRNYYVTITKGFKTGGFNSTIERPEDLTYGPESSWNYELGIKTPLFRDAAYLHFAAFYIDWNNQQIYQPVPSGRGSMLKNAGKSTSKGFEISLKTRSIYGFEPVLSYGHTHATFSEHVVDTATDYSGNYIPYVPKHTLSFMVNKSFRLKNNKLIERITANVGYKGAGKIFWNEKNSHEQNYYSLLSAKVSFEHKFLRFEIWGKNLLNTSYESFYFEALGNKYVQPGKPLQFGANILINF